MREIRGFIGKDRLNCNGLKKLQEGLSYCVMTEGGEANTTLREKERSTIPGGKTGNPITVGKGQDQGINVLI